MAFKMCASDVPACMVDSIWMPLSELAMILKEELPTLIRLTRSNRMILNRVLDARKREEFDYEVKEDDDDDNVVILMNDYIASPRHWIEADFAEVRC